MSPRFLRSPACLLLVLPLAACDGRQSVLNAAGQDSRQLLYLFIVMLAGAVVLWLGLNGLFLYVTRLRPQALKIHNVNWFLFGAGVLFPSVVIGALLAWGLSIMPAQRAAGDGLRIAVHAEEWWWRVEYWPKGATTPIVSANEIRFPAGSRSELHLSADTYIHSLWIPALGGKMDMIPGRTTVLTLHPDLEGFYRGQCAELCGASHALMAFQAVVMAPDDFARWLKDQAASAPPPTSPAATRGEALFRDEGCGACHTVRGTEFVGAVGPDLTHFASRGTLGAGNWQPTAENLMAWIAHADDLKPDVAMPAYDWLDPDQLADLAAYLKGLT
ncbi:cytochrome c oxidase subunit II [Paracoccus sp. 11-3]|uniref:Cytochrome c oxidase subunit II n=1 Tax=Paracoccus amoyensis TaxID=2760093 RepID=A0A926GIC4_9RHOB|nr:cytochrome c oxidase subunit II [Paracoccus amoyensis]